MKVIHRSEELLVLEDRPLFLGITLIAMALVFVAGSLAVIGQGEVFGGFLLGLVGGGVPVLIAALMVKRVRLTLDRRTGRLTRTVRSVAGLRQDDHALDRLTEATVAVNYDGDGNTYRTELQLRAPQETVPFTSYYTNGRKPQRMAEAVNDWLTTPKAEPAPGKAPGG